MTDSGTNWLKALGLAVLGIAIGVGGVWLGEYDDAPGASLIAIVLMLTALVFAVRIAKRKTKTNA